MKNSQQDNQKPTKNENIVNEKGLNKNNNFMKNMSLEWQEFYQAVMGEIKK